MRNDDVLIKNNKGQQVLELNDSSKTERCYDDGMTMSTIKLRRALRWGETNLYSVKSKPTIYTKL